MNVSGDLRTFLDTTAKILIRCVFMNFALALVWWLFFLIGRGYGFHSLMFHLTPHDVGLITYCGIAFIKICTIVFFLFPYVSIRWLLRAKRI